jgi:hypothetical protein
VDPTRQSVPEAGASRRLRQILIDRREAERVLTIVNEAGPDPDCATHLAMIRTANEQLETFVVPLRGEARCPPLTRG